MENSDQGLTSASPSTEQHVEAEVDGGGTAVREEVDEEDDGTVTKDFLQGEEETTTTNNVLEEEESPTVPAAPCPPDDANASVPLPTPTMTVANKRDNNNGDDEQSEITRTTTNPPSNQPSTASTSSSSSSSNSAADINEEKRRMMMGRVEQPLSPTNIVPNPPLASDATAAATTTTTTQPGAHHHAGGAAGNSRSEQERNKLVQQELEAGGAGGGGGSGGSRIMDLSLRESQLPQEMPTITTSTTASLPGAFSVDNRNNHRAIDASFLKNNPSGGRNTPPPPTTTTTAAAAAAANEESTSMSTTQQERPPTNTDNNHEDRSAQPSATTSTPAGAPPQSSSEAEDITTAAAAEEEEEEEQQQEQQEQHEEQQALDLTTTASTTSVVTARLVTETDEDTEKLQENYRKLQQRLLELENAPAATIVVIPEDVVEEEEERENRQQLVVDQGDQEQPPQVIGEEEEEDGEMGESNNIDNSSRHDKRRTTKTSQQQEEEEEPKDGNKMIRLTTIAVVCLILSALIIIIGILAGTGTFNEKSSGSSSSDTTTTTTTTLTSSTSAPSSSATTIISGTTPPINGNNIDELNERQRPTLSRIKERGYIRCRVLETDFTNGYGASIELCKMLSAAIFDGNTSRTEFYGTMSMHDMWTSIEDGTIDIATSMLTITMGRDVYEVFTNKPKSFSTPFHYTGVQLAGQPEFVDCVDRRDTLMGVCPNLVVCVAAATTTATVVDEYFHGGAGIHYVDVHSDLFHNLANGTCNVVAGEPHFLYEDKVRSAGYRGEYVHGSFLLSMEPIAMATREDDTQWTDFSTSVLQALFTAELEGITKENTALFPETNLFGEDYKSMYQNAIAGVGNFREVFDNTFGRNIDRDEVNMLKTTNFTAAGGLLYSPPIAGVNIDNPHFRGDKSPEVVANSAMELIGERGHLRCGILPDRPGFAVEAIGTNSTSESAWTGIDVDMCRCVATALFADPTLVEFVVLADQVAAYMALADDLVDVVAGAAYSLRAEINEESTKQGYSFSPSYFYGDGGEMLSLATHQNTTQWSDFVRWIVYGLIHAEEQGIGKEDASKMPSVDLFGPKYKLMFRLLVLNFGNYGDLYRRNLGGLIPRRGSNLLNDGTTPLVNPLPIDQFR